jgi:hypothetical protein
VVGPRRRNSAAEEGVQVGLDLATAHVNGELADEMGVAQFLVDPLATLGRHGRPVLGGVQDRTGGCEDDQVQHPVG